MADPRCYRSTHDFLYLAFFAVAAAAAATDPTHALSRSLAIENTENGFYASATTINSMA